MRAFAREGYAAEVECEPSEAVVLTEPAGIGRRSSQKLAACVGKKRLHTREKRDTSAKQETPHFGGGG